MPKLLSIALALATFVGALALPALGEESAGGGQVSIPLDVYQRLLEQAQATSRPAPAGFALGSAAVALELAEGASASVRADVVVEVLEDEWVLVPVLPAGTAVESATVAGQPVQLLNTPSGLAWSTRKSGSYAMRLAYRVEATTTEGGATLSLPLPEAASTRLDATLPGTGLDVALIPGTVVRQTEANGHTRIQATIPASRGTLLSFRSPASSGYAISRASYTGRLVEDTLVLRGELDVEIFDEASAALDLVPASVTVSEVLVDGERATIVVEKGRFAVVVRGRGRHVVAAELQVPVTRADGPPGADLEIPPVPVSSFELRLPGRKDVSVSPGGSVVRRFRDGATVATAHVPMSGRVRFSWSEAVPEDVRAELRWNASLYHLLYAEEGVLFGRVLAQYEVSRGATHVLELAVPEGVQINRVAASTGAVADWKVEGARLSVFLDRELRDAMVLEIELDRALRVPEGADGVDAPLFRAIGPQRQKGMVALLSDRDLALAPAGEVAEARFTRTGENQLPAFVREQVTRTVAHTFKYVDVPDGLRVAAVAAELEQGQFDARVDTLLSVGDASLRAASSVEVNVKSGSLMELVLALPEGVSLLDVVAPALREHEVTVEDGRQLVTLEFTQEMEGQFRVELTYERIVGAAEASVTTPRLEVLGAKIERGRLAVESLAAIEVSPAEASGLSPLDARDLPRQLVLQTTNPILLAYKYAQAEPPYRLSLGLRRHEIAAVQEATIDEARYSTLVTADGLAVTTARFGVRNARRQFLRLRLPEGAEVWSARVGGRPTPPAVSPARPGEDGRGGGVLLPIPSSSDGFVVELVYASRRPALGSLGRLEVSLGVPDVLVTRTRWDLFLPSELTYGAPVSSGKIVGAGDPVSAEEMKRELEASSAGVEDPPLLAVPRAGIRYSLDKLYANESQTPLSFAISYASAAGATLGQAAVIGGVLLTGLGLHLLLGGRASARVALACIASGLALALVLLSRYPLSSAPTLLLALGAAALWQRGRLAHLFGNLRELASRRRATTT